MWNTRAVDCVRLEHNYRLILKPIRIVYFEFAFAMTETRSENGNSTRGMPHGCHVAGTSEGVPDSNALRRDVKASRSKNHGRPPDHDTASERYCFVPGRRAASSAVADRTRFQP